MHTLELTNSGTGVRLAKRVKLISQKILRIENETRFLQNSDNIDKAKSEFIIEVNKLEIVALLDERKYLVECVIGFFAGDTFPVDFVMNTENIFFTDTSSKTLRANMAYCIGQFGKRVEALAANKLDYISGNPRLMITESKMEYVYSFINGNPDNESISEVTTLIGMSIISLIDSDDFAYFLNKKDVAVGVVIGNFNNMLAADKLLNNLLETEDIKKLLDEDQDNKFYSEAKCEMVYDHVHRISKLNFAYIEGAIGTSIAKVLDSSPYKNYAFKRKQEMNKT